MNQIHRYILNIKVTHLLKEPPRMFAQGPAGPSLRACSLVTLNLPACRGSKFWPCSASACMIVCVCKCIRVSVSVYGAAINTHAKANVLQPTTTTTSTTALPTIEVGWFVWGITDSQLTSVGRVLHLQHTYTYEENHHPQVTLGKALEAAPLRIAYWTCCTLLSSPSLVPVCFCFGFSSPTVHAVNHTLTRTHTHSLT